MNTYTALLTVPRKYIDVVTYNETDDDGVMQYVDRFSVDTLGFLHSPDWSAFEAIELDNFERNSMNINFHFDCPHDNTDDAGDWLEAKLPGDWHIDEIVEIEQQGVAA